MQKHDLPRAILEYRNAVQANVRNPEAHYRLAVAYLGERYYRGAVPELRQAIALNPDHTPAKLMLAQLMASVSSPQVLKDAQKQLQDLLQSNPQMAFGKASQASPRKSACDRPSPSPRPSVAIQD